MTSIVAAGGASLDWLGWCKFHATGVMSATVAVVATPLTMMMSLPVTAVVTTSGSGHGVHSVAD